MIIAKVLTYIKENKMLESGDHVVLGVSGGADSMCLLDVMSEITDIYGLKLSVVHVHHGIRGEEADRDKEYVENYCKDKDIDFIPFYYDIPAMAAEKGLSTEEAGRIARYEAFHKVMEDKNASKIAVAHNVGDNVETMLLNMCRGTGISGMTGIRPVRDKIIRPIMCLTRSEIEDYLLEKGIEYKTDSTNLSNDYTRNKVRNVVIPYLKENVNARADEHIGNLGEMIADFEDYVDMESEKYLEDIIISEEYTDEIRQIIVDAIKFEKLHKAVKSVVVRKIMEKVAMRLKDVTASHIASIIAIGEGETGKMVNLPYNVVAIKYPDMLILRRNQKEADDSLQYRKDLSVNVDKIPGKYETEKGAFLFEYDIFENANLTEKTYTKWLNCDILEADLQIRTRKNGDYIVVNESGGRKKLKDYFIDLKIPREKRDDILLLADGSRIIWVVGYRIGEDCKISKDTNRIVKVEFTEYNKERGTMR